MKVYTAAQMRAHEQLAVDAGTSFEQLMENAGGAAAAAAAAASSLRDQRRPVAPSITARASGSRSTRARQQVRSVTVMGTKRADFRG